MTDATPHAKMLSPPSTDSCLLLELPAEIRIHILSYLIRREPLVRNLLNRQNGTLVTRGATSGISHVKLVQVGGTWRVISIVKPLGFGIDSTAILRVCRELHNDAMGILYGKILFCIDILSSRVAAPRQEPSSGMSRGPFEASIFLKWMNHVHVRQDIHPGDDLNAKADQLESLLGSMRPDRKSSDVSLHFKSVMHRHTFTSVRAWDRYINRLAGLDLGQTPELIVWRSQENWKGWGPFESLAVRIGGYVDNMRCCCHVANTY